MNLYGLLHVSEDGAHSPNLKARGASAVLALYFRNAVLLSRSLRAAGYDFTLLTNDAPRLEALARGLGAGIAIRSIPFAAQVPRDIRFYSAHFKLDVYRWFARAEGGAYAGLIDLDMVALHPPSAALRASIAAGIPLVYDISDHEFAAYGEDVVSADLDRLLGGDIAIRRWYGGEFVAGPPSFFAELAAGIERVWDDYCRSFASFHHQGDETLSSAALCRMIVAGRVLLDAGPIGGVGRFWSGSTLSPQKPFAAFERCFLLHLPSDKSFLAAQAGKQHFRSGEFLHAYRRYLVASWPYVQARRPVKWALRKARTALDAGRQRRAEPRSMAG